MKNRKIIHLRLDGVTGRPRRKPLACHSAIEQRASLAASCATAAVHSEIAGHAQEKLPLL